jgi:predicted ester cyclase
LALVVVCAVACTSRGSRTGLVRHYLDELLVKQHWQQWDEFMVEHPRYNGVAAGRDAFQAVSKFLNTTFSELSVTLEDQLVDRAWVVTRVAVHCMQTGPFLNVPPRNRPVRFRAILMDRIEGGQVVEMWHEFDYWDALLQVAQP